ncbi:MAG TPA: TonB-dependent receptor, partial [Xanthobacteraceae bacterium]|nr:TonB-dependent receptor [Xanthobacteraceae bacterium]
AYGNAIGSDSYRFNNSYKQYNGVGDFRYTTDRGSLYLNITGDEQFLGLPGHRRVEPSKGINQVVTDPRGAFTPFDYGNRQGQSLTTGGTATLWPGAELIVDGGVRQKKQQGGFFGTFADPQSPDPRTYVDATMTTTSITPRLKMDSAIAGLPWRSISGIDWYRADYESPRSIAQGDPPAHYYDLSQTSYAAYTQHTVTFFQNTDVAAGGRIQRTGVRARDTFDPTAPGGCLFCPLSDPAGIPLDQDFTNRAFHIGFDHRVNSAFAVFGRHAQSFRVPNVDERVGAVTLQIGLPTQFDLKPQQSHDWESGVRLNAGPVNVQWSYYDMYLTNEIHFRYAPNFISENTNLDPTRRYGNETIASWQVTDTVRVKGTYSYTRAVFREGLFAGNDVPLVSRHTGSAGVAWNILDRRLVFDGTVRYVGARRMDNDQTNMQPLIPASTLVDVRLGGEIEQFFWSAAVLNLFDKHYFDYAIASPFPYGFDSRIGTYNAYTQPGRTFMVRAGLRY